MRFESLIALYVRKKPIGRRKSVAIHIPPNAVITFSFAYFSPLVLKKKKNIKSKIAITRGVPSPPFLIIEPKGAPIRNKTRQANDKVIFLCHSILCNRRSFCFTLNSVLAISAFNVIEPTTAPAFWLTVNKQLSGINCSNFFAVSFVNNGFA